MRPTPISLPRICPGCGAALAPTDCMRVEKTKWGRRVEDAVFPVTMIWLVILAIALAWAMLQPVPEETTVERGLGWMIVGLPLLPGLLLTIVSWFFHSVRVCRCRTCGHRHEIPLR
jgi:hypothetical protein